MPRSKSERNRVDAQAPLGMGATDTLGRMATSIFKLDASDPQFTMCSDVPHGGVLLALPALLATGLLNHSEKYFELPNGYYRLDSIFLLLSFMALARVKTVEKLRYYSPGEWGKLLGLDRIPEVKTLREKIGILSGGGQTSQWAGELSQGWMQMDPEASGVLYIDGHVRVYSGNQTKLPRHYVARQRLCLRATVDYWVNAMDSQPFFLINKEVDPGLIKVLEHDIVPRLEREVPCQPSLFELKENPLLHRFTLVFDREGYSPDFFKRMKDKRIACLTYHKYPGDMWPEEEFEEQTVRLSSGNVVKMRLAERGTFLGKKVWVREIRKLTESGHQTSILSTDYISDLSPVSVALFSRWSQENFFRYMRQHFNLDSLIDYSTEEISDTVTVVNPEYRKLDGEIRKLTGTLNRKWTTFNKIILPGMIEPENVEKYQQEKGELQEEIIVLEGKKEGLKEKRKNTEKHITVGQLPEKEQFQRLGTKGKQFIDTIKMIAYRAETSMVNIVRETMGRLDDARSLLQAIYKNEVDIIPDYNNRTLTIRLHQLANRSSGKTVINLCSKLNATKTKFPGTELRLIYELVS